MRFFSFQFRFAVELTGLDLAYTNAKSTIVNSNYNLIQTLTICVNNTETFIATLIVVSFQRQTHSYIKTIGGMVNKSCTKMPQISLLDNLIKLARKLSLLNLKWFKPFIYFDK